MKKQSQTLSKQDQSEKLPKFLDTESSVFTVVGKDIYIGKEKIPNVLRSLLRDESKNIQATRLWEILNASAINEAYLWSLDLSEDFELVQSAKMLKHWIIFVLNIMKRLEKVDN